ncbi:MAG: cell division ATP-binding protein FtsE [Candidatus Melainabacteria bacterium]|nr:cell division ATP-binding protein FtsE [Candidatus Melainabacteria bacterium]
MIQFVNVTKIYGELKALDDVSFEIGSGEMVFVVGPSGAGKSTLMKLLYREEKPTSGQVFVSSVDVSRLPNNQTPILRRRMGIVFQDFKLLPNKTSFENIAYPLFAIGMDQNEIKKRVHGALKVVSLTNKANDFPKNLSAGERQRVGIARAIVQGPSLLVTDEPTGNLDPTTSMEIFQLLERINQRGTTVLVATHNQQMVDQMKKRVIALTNGQVVSDVKSGMYTARVN